VVDHVVLFDLKRFDTLWFDMFRRKKKNDIQLWCTTHVRKSYQTNALAHGTPTIRVEPQLAPLLWAVGCGLFQSKQSTGPAEIRGPREKLPSSESAWHVSKERLAIAHRGYSHVYTVVPRCDLCLVPPVGPTIHGTHSKPSQSALYYY